MYANRRAGAGNEFGAHLVFDSGWHNDDVENAGAAGGACVCRQDSLEQLLLRLSVSENGVLKPFEAILHVKIARGVPVETDLVALREVAQ